MFSKKKPLSINLVPQDPFLETPLGRFMQWAMGAGRYIIIFTEIIVILSFGARFILDRQVTDLNQELEGLITAIEGEAELESQIRLVQAQTEAIRSQKDANNLLVVFEEIQRVLPQDVVFSQLSIGRDTFSAEGTALTQEAFSQLINNMYLSQQFSNMRVGKIESLGSSSTGFSFTLFADTRIAPAAAPKASAKPATPQTDDSTLGL